MDNTVLPKANICSKLICFLICLFGVLRPNRELFTNMDTLQLLVKGCNFDLCSALVTSKQRGFLTCHTHCDKGHPFIMVISKDP